MNDASKGRTRRAKPRPSDQHKSGFMVRLPEKFRRMLRNAQDAFRRPLTVEVQIALEKHLKDVGFWELEGDKT